VVFWDGWGWKPNIAGTDGMDAVCVVTDWDGTIFHYCAALYKGLSSG